MTTNTLGHLQLTSGYDASPTTVPCINPSDSFRTLGIYLLPSGSQRKQIKVLRAHADHFKAQILPAHLTPDKAFIAYMVYIRPKLTYPLPCCSINQQHCKHTQAPALAGLLPKLKLNHHTPHAILFAGPKYGGLNIPELYTVEGFGKLKLLIGHLKLQDDTGSLILILLSYLQIFIGSSKSVFSQSFSTFAKWVDYNWLTSLWQFTSQAKIVLDIEHKWLPQLPRENDAFIMDLALTYRFTPMQLKYINHCCLYLQVLTISEITDASGHHILTTATQGIKDSSRPSKYLWPHYPSPPRAVWQSWKIFLAHISRNAKLHQPLGSWRSPPHQEWHWYQSHSATIYYHDSESSTWYIYAPLPCP